MGNLTITPQWHDTINQVETDEFITGGADGNANLATRQLAEGLFWLKNYVMGLPTTTTPTTPTPIPTNSTGSWGFWYSISELNDLDNKQTGSGRFGKFTAQPIYDYFYELRFKSDLAKKARLPYSKFNQSHPAATSDGYSNRVLKYVAPRGQQPDFSILPVAESYQDTTSDKVLDFTYFGVADDGSVWLSSSYGFPDPSAKQQAGEKGIINASQINPAQYYDVYYVFLLDEKADNLLTNEQIAAQQWGNHHIEKVTMDTRWDVGTGGFTNVSTSTSTVTEGGNVAAIEA